MKWSNVKLIFARELRDQLRDRRTLFTVLVLPLLLYPLMGMALLQVSQFMREHPTSIWVIGSDNLPSEPPIIVNQQLNHDLLPHVAPELVSLIVSSQDDEQFLNLIDQFKNAPDSSVYSDEVIDRMFQEEMKRRGADLAVVVPKKVKNRTELLDETAPNEFGARVYVFRNSASDKSNMAAERFDTMVQNWQRAVSDDVLASKNLSRESMQSFSVAHADIADDDWKQAATWSKILPFIVLIWSLTGAFYPAVDLCAGEKERGTLETLLSSPAARSDIAIGKLLTVMTFSMVTSLLNLLSMGFTGIFVVSRLGAGVGGLNAPLLGAVGMPPISSIGWLLLALIPISALFSALALAAASFARSSKEGQSYLIPLMMICMPLMMLPMMPAAKLDFGTSLIPISGLMLMLRGLIEGQFSETIAYAGPVCGVTLACCWMAIRWVVIQFNSEKILFRPSERFGINVWIQEIFRKRSDLPLASHALLCGMLILVLKFFIGLGITSTPNSWLEFCKQTIIILVATIGMPAILMAMFLTHRPTKTLKLKLCSLPTACAAVLLAMCLHPVVMWITAGVIAIYPPTGDMELTEQLVQTIIGDAPGIWAILLVFALAPAVIEEFAFRGFILSGLQSLKSDWKAVLISSLLFGVAHSVLQQSIITFFVGMVIGYVAVRTSSILPCILYHFTHNSISVLFSFVDAQVVAQYPLLNLLLESSENGIYHYSIVSGVLLAVAGIGLLIWFWNQTHSMQSQRYSEEGTNWSRKLRWFAGKLTTK